MANVPIVTPDKKDIEFITNSLRMLPAWDNREWWAEFSMKTKYSLTYLAEKLSGLTDDDWGKANRPCRAAAYLLMFFDNPAVYEHLDSVAPTWDTRDPGRIGQRWSQQLCAAAWRILVADEENNYYSNKFPRRMVGRAEHWRLPLTREASRGRLRAAAM